MNGPYVGDQCDANQIALHGYVKRPGMPLPLQAEEKYFMAGVVEKRPLESLDRQGAFRFAAGTIRRRPLFGADPCEFAG